MPQIGPLELLVVGMLALIVFGPDKLPSIARSIGRTLSDLRRTAGDIRTELAAGFEDDDAAEVPEPPVGAPPDPDSLED